MSKERHHTELSRRLRLIGTQLCMDLEFTLVVPDATSMLKQLEREGFGEYSDWTMSKSQRIAMDPHVMTLLRTSLAHRRLGVSTRKSPPKFFRSSGKVNAPVSRIADQYDEFELAYKRLLLDAFYKVDKSGLSFPVVEDLHRLFLIAKDPRC